jgi:MarR family transcriptional regulator, transcriptional regulator for hemolysin
VRPASVPIGLRLTQVSRTVSRAFDDALAAAGGSVPVWLVLLNLKLRSNASQRELAEAMGISDATLTHHLNSMETAGLITRRRHPENRRVHVVELTGAGEAAFLRLRTAAAAFDQQLRRGFGEQDVADLDSLLARLAANVAGDGPPAEGTLPWAGIADG